MKKLFKKRILILILAAALLIAAVPTVYLFAFYNGNGNNPKPSGNGGTPKPDEIVYSEIELKSRDEILAVIDNYKITIEYDDGTKNSVTEWRCDSGVIHKNNAYEDIFHYVAFSSSEELGKTYWLNRSDNTGTVRLFGLESDITKYMSEEMAEYLFYFEEYIDLKFIEDGKDTIAGRGVTAYIFQITDTKYKIWLDDDTGLTMKYTVLEGNEPFTVEITEIQIGGVDLSDILDLNQFEIEDLTEFSTEEDE